jgi:hypothetical protein
MNFAFLIRSRAAFALRAWALGFLSASRSTPVVPSNAATPSLLIPTTQPEAVSLQCPTARPLRVVRVVERGQSRSDVGRMVISGRMADVCAELDRLAAREAAESSLPTQSVAMAC